MSIGIQYTIKQNRYKQALRHGIVYDGDTLICTKEEIQHTVILRAIDSANEDFPWGRLRFEENFQDDVMRYMYVFSNNQKVLSDGEKQLDIDEFLQASHISFEEKKDFMKHMGAIRFVNKKDVLLYELKGRYLWIVFEIIGETEGQISGLAVNAPGDNFMKTFPEVYQNHGDFFHRYMSVFSSVYNDFQEKIDETDKLLDLETASPELLQKYAEWLGLMVNGGFLSEEALRGLIQEAYMLNKYKGTRRVIERLCEIVLGVKPIIVEKNMLKQYTRDDNQEVMQTLYGTGTYDVTLLIPVFVDEKKQAQLFYLLKQFKPIRCKLHIVFLQETGILDTYSYLDMNAKVFEQNLGSLNDHQLLNGTVVLE